MAPLWVHHSAVFGKHRFTGTAGTISLNKIGSLALLDFMKLLKKHGQEFFCLAVWLSGYSAPALAWAGIPGQATPAHSHHHQDLVLAFPNTCTSRQPKCSSAHVLVGLTWQAASIYLGIHLSLLVLHIFIHEFCWDLAVSGMDCKVLLLFDKSLIEALKALAQSSTGFSIIKSVVYYLLRRQSQHLKTSGGEVLVYSKIMFCVFRPAWSNQGPDRHARQAPNSLPIAGGFAFPVRKS